MSFIHGKTRINDRELEPLVKSSRRNIYKVTYIGDPKKNWLITENGVGMAGESYKTKAEAVKQARKIASKEANLPSVMIVEYSKDSKHGQAGVADWQNYDG